MIYDIAHFQQMIKESENLIWKCKHQVYIAVAGHAAREAAAVVALVAVAGRARLAELTHVALGTRAHLDPNGRLAHRVVMRWKPTPEI
jgi:hypothetical protein